jgi:hypothetical protein
VQALLISETRMRGGGPDGFVLGFAGYGERELVVAAQRLGAAAREVVDGGFSAALGQS